MCVCHFAYILTLQQKFQVGQTQQQQQQLLLLCCSLTAYPCPCSYSPPPLPSHSSAATGQQQPWYIPYISPPCSLMYYFLTLTCVGFCQRHRLIILHNIIRRFPHHQHSPLPPYPPSIPAMILPSKSLRKKKSFSYRKTFQKLDKISHLPVRCVCWCVCVYWCVYWLIRIRIK